MKTNVKGILLTEVNRMREIMGMNIINEGIDDIIKKLFGVSDEGAQTILKGNTDDLGQYSSKLKTLMGSTSTVSLSDITSYLSRQGLETTDDAIAAWIKTQPDVLDQIARSSSDIMKQASEVVFGRLKLANILTQDSMDEITDLMTLSLNKNRVDSMITEIDRVLVALQSAKSRGTTNRDLEDLIKQLEDKRTLAQNYKSNLNSSGAGSGTKPVVGSSTIDDDLAKATKKAELNKTISEIRKYVQTGDWSKLGFTPTFINPYKKEMMSWFELRISDLESGRLTKEEIMSQAKTELEKIVKKKQLKDLTPKEKDGYFLFKSLRGSKGRFWSSPAGIGIILGLGFAATQGDLLLFAADAYKNNKQAIDEINGGEFTVEDCQKYFNDNGYSQTTANSVEMINDTKYNCKWTKGSSNGDAPFVLKNGNWEPE